MIKNMTDVTDLSDAALDVVLAVKAGEDCVTVDHLTADERRAVCKALSVNAREHWIMAAPYAAPEAAPRVRVGGRDVEAEILTAQDDFFED